MTKVLISQTTDGKVGRAVLERPASLNSIIAAIILTTCVVLLCLMFGAISFVDNLIPLIFCLLSLVAYIYKEQKRF